jgi:hypothetical protein
MNKRRVDLARKAKENCIRRQMSEFMRKVGLHPSFIYAWEKTGMLVVEDSAHTEEQKQEWIAACDEWHEQNPEQSLDLEDDDATA